MTHAIANKIAKPITLAKIKSILKKITENNKLIPKPVPIKPKLSQSGTSLVLMSVYDAINKARNAIVYGISILKDVFAI